jgi:hypothetical protein
MIDCYSDQLVYHQNTFIITAMDPNSPSNPHNSPPAVVDPLSPPLLPPHAKAPLWVMITGIVFLGLTLLFVMGLIIAAIIVGKNVVQDNKVLIVMVFSLGTTIGSSFLFGAACVNGNIPIPFSKKRPIEFTATGGIAVLVISMLLSFYVVSHLDGQENDKELVFTINADPEGRGGQPILYDNNNPDVYPRNNVSNVEYDSKNRTFTIRLVPGAKEGSFSAIHLSKSNGPTLQVTYFVSQKNIDQNNPAPKYELVKVK